MEQLPATYAFEAKLNSLDTWLSLVNATSTPGQYITNLLSNDPFFTEPGSAYRLLMQRKLDEFMKLQSKETATCSTSVDLGVATLWQIAQSSVFCRNKNKDGCENSEESQCLINSPGTPDINPATGCAQDWDMVWKFYRGAYLTERNKFISQYLNGSCPVTSENLITSGYTPRFVDFNDPTGIGHVDNPELQHFLDQIAAGDNSSVTTGEGLLAAQFDTTCRGYASVWISQLSACDLLFERWNDQVTKTADSTWLVSRLMEVCKNGSDLSHYLGSSSVIPGNVTESGFSDFPQVIQLFLRDKLGITNATDECNPYLITIPAPYDKQQPLTEMVVITKPTDCECTQINKVFSEYSNASYGGSFSEYMLQRYQVTISDSALNYLKGLCDGSYTCVFLPEAIRFLFSRV